MSVETVEAATFHLDRAKLDEFRALTVKKHRSLRAMSLEMNVALTNHVEKLKRELQKAEKE
jgi:hypothetical protein